MGLYIGFQQHKVTCPKNDMHKTFVTTARVMQDWVVDETGSFMQVDKDCVQVDHYPEKGNCFTCRKCNAEAIVEEI